MNQHQLSKKIHSLCKKIRDSLVAEGLTIGFAESCTGGSLSAYLTAQPGISAVYKGSIVSYSRELKQKLLMVPSDTIDSNGEVSKDVALAMAMGGIEALNSDICVSVSGIAGPSGGSEEKPVGTVCFAIVGKNIAQQSFRCLFESSLDDEALRQDIQHQSVYFALKLILNNLTSDE